MRFDVEGECHVVWYGLYGYQYLSVARGWCPFVGRCRLTTNAHPIWCNGNRLISRSEEEVSPRNHLVFWLLMHVQPVTAFELLITQPRHVLCPGQGAKQMWSQWHTAAMSEPRSLPRNIRQITVAEKWWDVQKLSKVETAATLIGQFWAFRSNQTDFNGKKMSTLEPASVTFASMYHPHTGYFGQTYGEYLRNNCYCRATVDTFFFWTKMIKGVWRLVITTQNCLRCLWFLVWCALAIIDCTHLFTLVTWNGSIHSLQPVHGFLWVCNVTTVLFFWTTRCQASISSVRAEEPVPAPWPWLVRKAVQVEPILELWLGSDARCLHPLNSI